jgi:uncharacterized glyoxalase superfamily protein PhnB
MLVKMTPNLMVENVRRTIEFYQQRLGFDLIMTLPEQPPFDFAIVRRDQIQMMFQSRQSLTENVPALAGVTIGASQTFYIEVMDLLQLYEELQAHVEIVVDLHETFYGTREFYFRDINGYILSFSEPVTST